MIDKKLEEYDEAWNKYMGEALLEIRTKSKLTMTDFAIRVGISYPGYFKYEKGLRTCPLSIVKKICAVFDVDFNKLLNKVDKKITVDFTEEATLGN